MITGALGPCALSVPGEQSLNRQHECKLNSDPGALFFQDHWPITERGESLSDLRSRKPSPDSSHRLPSNRKFNLQLNRDAVLPTPWHRRRLINCIATIGHSRRDGDWQSSHNHSVTLLMPFGLAIVVGGNHSIATGICNGEGQLVSTATLDFTPAYDHVKYDGINFRRICDGKSLSQPIQEEPGLLFEIGRHMNRLNIAYDANPVDDDEHAALVAARQGSQWQYHVWIDGHDTGACTSSSGIERAMLAEGIQRTDRSWNDILYGQHTLKRVGLNGEIENLEFRPSPPRPQYDDLRWIPRPLLVRN